LSVQDENSHLDIDAMTPTQDQAAKAGRPLNPDGKHLSYENSHTSIQLNSAEYWTARIARDAPDIYNGMLQGKYRSVILFWLTITVQKT
jgi:hypothetical protein